jgi:hypothetical protein
MHPELWPEMGKSGRKIVEEHYNIRKLNKKLMEIFQDLLYMRFPIKNRLHDYLLE